MDGEYIVSTDKKEKIKLDSQIVFADWLSSIARGGAEAELRVKTVFVAEGSTIEIKGRSSEGKAPDSIKGKVYNDEFVGKLLIPEKVKLNAEIWFEAKLPKHGLKMESGTTIPGKPPILANKICWDRSEVKRGDEVLLTCQFESGVADGEDAVIIIYEHNPNSYDFKITSFLTTIKNNKVEATWAFDYYDDTEQIATHEELKPVGKSYAPPQYYFVVVVDGVKVGDERQSGLLKFKDWVEFELEHSSETALSDFDIKLTYADGSNTAFLSSSNGKLRIDNITPGPIKFELQFANLKFKNNRIKFIEIKSGSSLLLKNDIKQTSSGNSVQLFVLPDIVLQFVTESWDNGIQQKPLQNIKCKITIDSNYYETSTDFDGKIDLDVPDNAISGKILLEFDKFDMVFPLIFSGFNDPDINANAINRLRNLGFFHHKINQELLTIALKGFQAAYDLEITGALDVQTSQKLIESHGI